MKWTTCVFWTAAVQPLVAKILAIAVPLCTAVPGKWTGPGEPVRELDPHIRQDSFLRASVRSWRPDSFNIASGEGQLDQTERAAHQYVQLYVIQYDFVHFSAFCRFSRSAAVSLICMFSSVQPLGIQRCELVIFLQNCGKIAFRDFFNQSVTRVPRKSRSATFLINQQQKSRSAIFSIDQGIALRAILYILSSMLLYIQYTYQD